MNDRPRLQLLPALLLGLLLGACTPAGDPPLKGASIGGPFALIDQNGHRRSDRDFAGRYRIVYFGYTHCPDVCPADLLVMSKALDRFEKTDPARGAAIQPLFVTVDPERDTPPVLKAYLASFHPRLIGLTGTPAEIARVAKEYVATYSRGPAEPDGDYPVGHSRQMLLMGRSDEPVALLPADQGADAVVTELDRWVR
jgi:protein SCO1/2